MIEQDVLDRIQQLLTFKHWSLYKLAKQSDIPYSSLNNIFNRQTCPTMVTLEKICHGFNISLSEFFSFESNPLRNELLSDDEEELLNTYKELSVQNKKLLKAYLDVLCKRWNSKRLPLEISPMVTSTFQLHSQRKSFYIIFL